jgi:PBP1b-binding outer membrane lipoprotein LpoB
MKSTALNLIALFFLIVLFTGCASTEQTGPQNTTTAKKTQKNGLSSFLH